MQTNGACRSNLLGLQERKKRWGSCSQQNSLNFSLRLAMVPPETLEYVVVHELAHTRHHDHSRAFGPFWGSSAAWL